MAEISLKQLWDAPDSIFPEIVRQYAPTMKNIANRENPNNYSRITVLHRVAGIGDLETVKLLVEQYDGNINSVTRDEGGLLHFAAGSGNILLVQWLIEEKELTSMIHSKDGSGSTPICNAVMEGSLPICKYLVSKGADVHIKTGGINNTLLHKAACFLRLDIMHWLVEEHGLDVHARTNYGDTVLHKAACFVKEKHMPLIGWLVNDKHVDVNAKNNIELTARDISAQVGKGKLFDKACEQYRDIFPEDSSCCF
jgi:ankyrin